MAKPARKKSTRKAATKARRLKDLPAAKSGKNQSADKIRGGLGEEIDPTGLVMQVVKGSYQSSSSDLKEFASQTGTIEHRTVKLP